MESVSASVYNLITSFRVLLVKHFDQDFVLCTGAAEICIHVLDC